MEQTDRELLQDEYELLAVEHEKTAAELKKLKKLESLRLARPAQTEVDVPTSTSSALGNAGGINLSAVHLTLLGCILGILGMIWNYMGAPLTDMRDNLRDIKANYVKKEDLRDLARKSDLDAVKMQADRHDTKFAQYDQLKEQRDSEAKGFQNEQSKLDSNQNAFEQRLTRLEALKGAR